MMMVKRSLASVVVALICFLYFNASTETQVDGHHEGKQFGLAVHIKTQIQNYDPNEVSIRSSHEKYDNLQQNTASPSVLPKQIRSVLNQWCIVKPSTPAAILDGIIQFCCTQSRIDCRVIQPGGICYDPATNKVSDASVVMNLYYKVAGKSDFNCYFNGSGLILTQDPSVGKCIYPA